MQKYECSVCGYIYNPEKGDIDGGIIEGISFEDLPEDWTCPICRSEKKVFNKAKEENIAPKNDSRIEEEVNITDYDNNSCCNDGNCKL